MIRHFVFYDSAGAWVREAKGEIGEPPADVVRLSGDAGTAAREAWLASVTPFEESGEVALDITHKDWPVGSMFWTRFEPVSRVVSWIPRKALELDSAFRVQANHEVWGGPLELAPGRIAIDITDTALAPFLHSIWGQFERRDGQWALVADTTNPALVQTSDGLKALEAARVDLDPVVVGEKVYAEVR